ncbi:hypothetical protein PC116_g11323 [Phytophthora cactorum]|uniref:Uncharacterized protein n=1 Tax=Phytophthora cactorum TaxID=29920 RepID=A0A8T0Z5X5_9STRA|nr:hypothetical protein PC112_g10273 [Phytophthora cactorum]KAG2826268.1 hypothetical protein PC111_g9032 [Phytophthora cactorum]KAG2857425.1 hypothetical protein PC113_g10711 [Phytophthora cactorum]KAG2921972.1 hypothetical protein PC115_g9363 [Phytophthora cactorum]KAG2943967.1 hypothetical protein PC117_g9247 [Phytophthora cactorum]
MVPVGRPQDWSTTSAEASALRAHPLSAMGAVSQPWKLVCTGLWKFLAKRSDAIGDASATWVCRRAAWVQRDCTYDRNEEGWPRNVVLRAVYFHLDGFQLKQAWSARECWKPVVVSSSSWLMGQRDDKMMR